MLSSMGHADKAEVRSDQHRYADPRRINVYLRGGTEYAEPMLDFNPARVMSTLCRVHGHELLKDGLLMRSPCW